MNEFFFFFPYYRRVGTCYTLNADVEQSLRNENVDVGTKTGRAKARQFYCPTAERTGAKRKKFPNLGYSLA